MGFSSKNHINSVFYIGRESGGPVERFDLASFVLSNLQSETVSIVRAMNGALELELWKKGEEST